RRRRSTTSEHGWSASPRNTALSLRERSTWSASSLKKTFNGAIERRSGQSLGGTRRRINAKAGGCSRDLGALAKAEPICCVSFGRQTVYRRGVTKICLGP